MLAVRTRDSWIFSLTVNAAGMGAETYTNAAAANSAYDSIVALLAWLNDAARGWFGVVTFAWSWARNPAATGGALLQLMSTGGTFTTTLGSLAWLGFPASGATSSLSGTVGALGTWDPPQQLSVRGYLRHVDAKGQGSGTGVLRGGVAGLAHRRPQVETGCYRTDVGRVVSVLASAANPRQGWIYQESASAWRLLVLGNLTQVHPDPLITIVSLEVIG
jgi:hypothetical protein